MADAERLVMLFLSLDIYPAAPAGHVLAAAGLAAGLIIVALTGRQQANPAHTLRTVRGPWLWAFTATAAQFALTYSLWPTGWWWPLAVTLSLLPVVAALVALRRTVTSFGAPSALRVVSGIVWFFLLLDLVIGLGGRYDLTAGAVLAGTALIWLRRRAEDGLVPT